jgi:hypothetical protein
MERWWWLLALGSGVAVGTIVVVLGARATRESLTTAGADMQAGFTRIGAMTQAQLQAQADQWAQEGYIQAKAKINLAAQNAAFDVVQNTYGITPQFIADLQRLQARLTGTTPRASTTPGKFT